MSVTRVAYSVDGWGEGELWLDGVTLLWHELPQPRVAPRVGAAARERNARTRPHQPWPEATSGVRPHPGGGTSRRPSRSTIPREMSRDRVDSAPEVARLVGKLERYFRGERIAFDDVALRVVDRSPFHLALVEALRAVPWGELVSYGELARNAGYPNAQRAAGTFCAQNRFPIVVPCHRVVAAHDIGGYGSLGVAYKRRMLELEGVTL